MPLEIKNLTQRPVLMRLNSGATLHLSPGMSSDPIVEEEVDRNEKVAKLQNRHLIALTEVESREHKGATARTATAKTTRKPRKK